MRLNADVFFGCLMHAYSTEREEVMGLLIGEVADASGSAVEGLPEEQVVEISNLIILSRVDKRKDRCEISSEQLVAATMQAEVSKGSIVATVPLMSILSTLSLDCQCALLLKGV